MRPDLLTLALVWFGATLAAAQASPDGGGLRVDPLFGDHMVLQREQPVRVWGQAAPGDFVLVRLADRVALGTADARGAWEVELAPLPAGGPHTLHVQGQGESLALEDVLVGEVWLCAGQSNMWWPLARAASAATAIPAADLPQLRLFDLQGVGDPGGTVWDAETLARCTPEDFYRDPTWRVSSPESARDFSAVAWWFGRELQERLGVPVGLIHNAVGGTPIESYIRLESLRSHALLAPAAADPERWFDNPALPAWPRSRGRHNLSGWLADPVGPLPGHPFQPGFLFEAGIRPLARLGLRGALWYQGESNATGETQAVPTDPALAQAGIETLIADWRRAFGQPALPFLYVQLPAMGRRWMEFREAQRRCLAIPGTSMAVTLDLGHPTDVHPRNKREVGRRLALLARADVYGEDLPGAHSPRVSTWRAEGGTLVVAFTDTTGGLTTRDGAAPRGFELAGEDGLWHAARATLAGDEVRLTATGVRTPHAVRYAWAPVPDANLVGGSGLPASPFFEGDAAPPLARTSFEEVAPGPFTTLATSAGTWTAAAGHAVVDAGHRRSGAQCLHLVGGEARQVVLDPATDGADLGALDFWAERWTQRDPFVFRIEGLFDGAWRELYRGDEEVTIGTFRTHVRVPIDAQPERLRWTCTSPSGVLIDDLRFGLRAPMELLSATSAQPVLPALLGNAINPVAEVRVETRGLLDPLAVRGLDVDLSGCSDLTDVARVRILSEDGTELAAGTPADAVRLTLDEPLPLREGTNRLTLSLTLAPGADLDHVVDAQGSILRFSDGTEVAPVDATPGVVQRIGVDLRDAGDDGAAVYRIPALTTTTAGTLVAVYDVRWQGWGDLPGDVDVGLSRSTDGGRTWEPMRIVLDLGDDPAFRFDGVGDPAILVDRVTGTIWVAAVWSHGDRGWNGSGPGLTPDETGQLVLTRSDDDGLTWSAPIRITDQVKRPAWCYLLQGPGRGITMQDGTLVFAAQYQDTPENDRLPHATILYSRDHGETWQLGTAAKPNTTEAQVVELEPGRLMLNLRDNRGGARSVYTTDDLGQTWQEHATSRRALPEPVCNAALLRMDEDVLLFVNPAVDAPPRRRMTLKASLDLGATWPEAHQLLLDEGQSAGYPSLTRIDAETVGVLFEGSRAHLTFLRIPLDAVLR